MSNGNIVRLFLFITTRKVVFYLFSKKKKGDVKEVSQPVKTPPAKGQYTSKAFEAWGWAASAARFRGFLLMLMSVGMVILSFTTAILYIRISTDPVIVVGVDNKGERQIFLPINNAVNPQMFCLTFINKFLNYAPSTIESNLAEAMNLSTPKFIQAFEYNLSESLGFKYTVREFIRNIKDDDIVQVNSLIQDPEIEKLTEHGFIAKVPVTQYRTILEKTTTKRVLYTLDVASGPVTLKNPWGYYVQGIQEQEIQGR